MLEITNCLSTMKNVLYWSIENLLVFFKIQPTNMEFCNFEQITIKQI